MCMSSTPASTQWAARNYLKLSIGLVARLMARLPFVDNYPHLQVHLQQHKRTLRSMNMIAVIQHIKKIAVADTRLFFEPFVSVFKFIKKDFTRSSVKH